MIARKVASLLVLSLLMATSLCRGTPEEDTFGRAHQIARRDVRHGIAY